MAHLLERLAHNINDMNVKFQFNVLLTPPPTWTPWGGGGGGGGGGVAVMQ